MSISEKIEIVDRICNEYNSENTDFNSTKCLTYIDEFEQKLEDKRRATSIVSFTALKEHYISYIEKEWLKKIRNVYGFRMGEPIHFTKVRRIAQSVGFKAENNEFKELVGWNDEYILSRANSLIDYEQKKFKSKVKSKDRKNFIEEYKVWQVFRKEDENGFGTLDVEKLKNFYEDIFKIIKDAKFNILCTTILYDTKAIHRTRYVSDQVKSAYTIAFGEHLDLLCFYLKNGFLSDEEYEEKNSYNTKLRWDGDDGFNTKGDYRLLFNKVISLGTTHYQSDTVRKCLDEIRFINKYEIGYYDDIDNPKIVSHIGCDIADFISYFVGKYSLKEEIIELYKKQGKSEDEAERTFLDTVTFTIGNRTFSPYEEILKEKILNTDNYKSIQIMKECQYNIW
mgnify:CR=1 FL=1